MSNPSVDRKCAESSNVVQTIVYNFANDVMCSHFVLLSVLINLQITCEIVIGLTKAVLT